MTTRLERNTAETMAAHLEGDALLYQEETSTGHLWRCDACGLVWTRRHQADGCTGRGHVSSFVQRYAYRLEGFEQHGRYGYNEYTRRAVRRDAGVKAVAVDLGYSSGRARCPHYTIDQGCPLHGEVCGPA